MGIVLSSSIGFGATMNVNGTVVPADYDYVFVDMDPVGPPLDFSGTASDIEALYWGQDGAWVTFGMTTIGAPINTTGDESSPFTHSTTVYLRLIQGGVEQYWLEVSMRSAAVESVRMWDTPNGVVVPLTAPTDLRHEVGDDLEIAIHAIKFANLTPAPFAFDLVFEGGGPNQDDGIQGVIPEPATMSMLLVGGLLAVARRRRKR
jgi:hypothetical protein